MMIIVKIFMYTIIHDNINHPENHQLASAHQLCHHHQHCHPDLIIKSMIMMIN